MQNSAVIQAIFKTCPENLLRNGVCVWSRIPRRRKISVLAFVLLISTATNVLTSVGAVNAFGIKKNFKSGAKYTFQK